MLLRKSILGLFLLALLAASQTATGQNKDKVVGAGKEPAVAKPKDLIVGTWELANPKKGQEGTITFTKQGGVIVEVKGGPKLEGMYKFLNDEMMEVELKPPAGLDLPPQKQKLKVKVSKDEMTMIDEKGTEDKFKRKK